MFGTFDKSHVGLHMNSVLSENLYTSFPRIYRGRRKSKYESGMCWGFECGDGWYQLLYDLSQELESYLAVHPDLDFDVVQVKAKAGSLRFRLNGRDAAVLEMVARAERRADTMCELCGKPGRLYGHIVPGPPIVLCDEDAATFRLAGSAQAGEDVACLQMQAIGHPYVQGVSNESKH